MGLTPKNVLAITGAILLLCLLVPGLMVLMANAGFAVGAWIASPTIFPGFSAFEKIVVVLLTVICFVQVFGS